MYLQSAKLFRDYMFRRMKQREAIFFSKGLHVKHVNPLLLALQKIH